MWKLSHPYLEPGFGSAMRTTWITGPNSPCLNQRCAKVSLVYLADESPLYGDGVLAWF